MVDPATLVQDLRGLRALAVLGDSDHDGSHFTRRHIGEDSPAGKYLISHGRASRRISIPTERGAGTMK